MRGQLSQMLGVPPERVRVVAEEVGGGFGVRFNAYPEYGALLLAAQTLGRPVKWVGSRAEVFLGDEQARDIFHRGELALDAGGRILGMRFTYLANLGAYVAFTGSFVNTMNMVNVISGVYDVQAVHVQGRLVLTNTVPTAAYRGAGRPVRPTAERSSQAAREPAPIGQFRRRNLCPRPSSPDNSPASSTTAAVEGVMAQAMKEAEWAGFESAPAEREARETSGAASPPTSRQRSGGFAPYTKSS